MNTAAFETQLPSLSGHVAAVDYSGCCAVFEDGFLVANGALLWTGRHIITTARDSMAWASPENLTFLFNTQLPYAMPTALSIDYHPDYNDVTMFYDHNIAIITLADEVDSVISRYNLYTKNDWIYKKFHRCMYSRQIDFSTGDFVKIG